MRTELLHVLVDSREPSVTFARAFYQEIGRPGLGLVEHIRPRDFGDSLCRLVSTTGNSEAVLVAARYLNDDQLEMAAGLLESSGAGNRVTIASYDCFGNIISWCRDNGLDFRAIEYKQRLLSSSSETLISKYLDSQDKVLPQAERLALERIWVQYRLILSIISRQKDLGQVIRELISDPGFDRQCSNREIERVFRYYKLGEPDMAGGSYAAEKVDKNLIDQLRERINYIAATDYHVLIQGESGSGKETTAWAIHELSSRRDRPFMAVNCAGFSDELLESEMFGYVKGSHSQAETDYAGILEQVDGGTLFLDELPDMGQRIQAKLLRCMESGEFRPVGGKENHYADVRVIGAGQTALINDSQKLRPDLKSRIGQLGVTVHPLRDNEAHSPGTIYKIAYILLERYTWTTVFRDGATGELTPADIRSYQHRLEDEWIIGQLSEAQWNESNIRELNTLLRQWIVFGDRELARLSAVRTAASPVLNTLPPILQQEQIGDYLMLPGSPSELKAFFERNPFNDLKRAYISYVSRVYSSMIEEENLKSGLRQKPTQKALAKLIGITENTLSRYRN